MARHWFGQSVTDYTVDIGVGNAAVFSASVTITFWNASSGGTQYTDLLDSVGDPITEVVSGDGGVLPVGTIPRFQGPDAVTNMWADAGGGTRYLMVATDLADTVSALVFDQAWEEAMQALLASGAVGQYLGKDPDPSSNLGIIWGTPPTGSGGGGSSIWVDASTGAYAADKTGGSDARAAIQAAIDDVYANGGGTVYLPAGTYLISYTSNAASTSCAGGLQLRDKVWLKGEGFATRLEATGTWSGQAGIIAIGDRSTTRAVRDTRVSDLWIKGTSGTSYAGSTPSNIHGILYNTASISGEPDAVHRIHDVHLWDLEVGIALLGSDDQAMHVQRIRGRHFTRQGLLVGKEDGSGGGPDNYFLGVDISSANFNSGGTYAGIEVYSSNCHFAQCKSWYNKRSTAFSSAATYKDGAGWYLKATRTILVSCEAQDNGGHGYLINLGKTTLTGCVADSNNYTDNISGSASTYECSGFSVTANASELSMQSCLAFDRNTTNRYQKYGYSLDPSVRNVLLTGIAWDNNSSTADPLYGVGWPGGSAHSTHEVRVLSAYGSTRTTITSGGTSGTAGSAQKRQTPTSSAFTGTTLQDVTQLSATVPGGTRWYKVEVLLLYRADATNNARIALKATRDTGSGTVDIHWQADYLLSSGAAGTAYELSSVGTTRYVVADGDGGVGSSGFTNQRSIRIIGTMFVGSTVTNGTVTLQVAEDGGSGTGVAVVENSVLLVTPMAFS